MTTPTLTDCAPDPKGFLKIKLAMYAGLLFSGPALAMVALSYSGHRYRGGIDSALDPKWWVVICFAISFGFMLASIGPIRRHERAWISQRISLTPDRLTKSVRGETPEHILLAEITEVKERPWGLVVKGEHSFDVIIVPLSIQHYSELKAALMKVASLSVQQAR